MGSKRVCHNKNICTFLCQGDAYPALQRERTMYYEGQSAAQITTEKAFSYGGYGNVKRFEDRGDVSIYFLTKEQNKCVFR